VKQQSPLTSPTAKCDVKAGANDKCKVDECAFTFQGTNSTSAAGYKYCVDDVIVSVDGNGDVSGVKCGGDLVGLKEVQKRAAASATGSSGDSGSGGSDPSSVPSSDPSSGSSSGSSPGPSPGSTTNSGGSNSSCFPASATVELSTGETKRMDELNVDDRVRVGASEFSPVFMFTHKLNEVVNTFIQLHTASGHSVSATPGHYLYINGDLAPASSIKVGDMMTTADGEATRVVQVSRVLGSGLFNPQTVHGDIVVDGIMSSTYTTAVAPSIAHKVLAPFCAAYAAVGFSTTLFEAGSPLHGVQ
jgi:Hint module